MAAPWIKSPSGCSLEEVVLLAFSVMPFTGRRGNGLWPEWEGEGCKVWTETQGDVFHLWKGHERPLSQWVHSPPSKRPTSLPFPIFSIYMNSYSQTLLEEKDLVFFRAVFHPPHHLEGSLSRAVLSLAIGAWETDGRGWQGELRKVGWQVRTQLHSLNK